jgi:hypothetical protein
VRLGSAAAGPSGPKTHSKTVLTDNVLRREGERRTGQQVSVRECALAA